MSDAFSPETLARQIIVRYRGTGMCASLFPQRCAKNLSLQ